MADGFASAQQADESWPDYCKILGIKDLEKDPRFNSNRVREEHAEELIAIMDKIFATRSREEWFQDFKRAKSGIAVSPLNRVSELSKDTQILANGYITKYEHPTAGEMLTPGRTIEFSKASEPPIRRASELGENTEEVLIDLLGYSWNEIESLRREGVI